MNRRTFVQHAAGIAALPLVGPWQPLRRAPRHVNADRLNGWLAAFDRIGRTASGMNRVAYSPADLEGRAFAMQILRDSGLTPRIDAAGNILARLEGSASLPPILIGSHIDSVTDGGNYDGPVGAFGAIEVARSIREQGIPHRHPIEVVIWSNEEGGVIGSTAAIRALTDVELDKVARSGKTMREGITLVGGDPTRLDSARRKSGDLAAYLELHIEQGGLLEQAKRQIGVVQGIVGLRWFEVTITGFANHAGATPMDQRQDALLAASLFTVAVNEAVRAEPGRQVATVGRMVVTPNTTNVIPSQVVLTIDLRDLDANKLAHFSAKFEELARGIGAKTGTAFAFKSLQDSAPALATPSIMEAIERACGALGLTNQRMPSGAGHDAQELAHVAPMGMIFVPSVGGISHSPREFSRPAEIAQGADVLLNTVLDLDR